MKKKNDQSKKTLSGEKGLRSFVIWNKYILFKDIQKAFYLSKEDSNHILSEIMKSFWKNGFNLFCLSWLYPEFFKDGNNLNIKMGGKTKLDPTILTCETFRNLIRPYIKNKKQTKRRDDLFLEHCEYIDGENDLYKEFICEDWGFYQQIINKINRNYRKNLSQTCRDNDLKKKQVILSEQIEAAGEHFMNLYLLNTLAIEVKDLLGLSSSPILDIQKGKVWIKIKEHLKNIQLKNGIKIGYFLTDDFIFSEYLKLKKKDNQKTDTEISKEIFTQFNNHTPSGTTSSPSRIRKIINDRKHYHIKGELISYLDDISPDLINKISNTYFTSPKQTIKILMQLRQDLKDFECLKVDPPKA